MNEKEAQIFQAIRVLGDDAYGVTIRRELRSHLSGWRKFGAWSYGTLYVRLDRMEQDGWIESRMEPGGAVRNYNRKKCYRPSRGGMRRFTERLSSTTDSKNIMPDGKKAGSSRSYQ